MYYMKTSRKLKFDIFLLHPTPSSNSRTTLRSMFSIKGSLPLPRNCLRTITEPQTRLIKKELFCESRKAPMQFQDYHMKSMFFIAGVLMLPRRYLQSLKESPTRSRQKQKIHMYNEPALRECVRECVRSCMNGGCWGGWVSAGWLAGWLAAGWLAGWLSGWPQSFFLSAQCLFPFPAIFLLLCFLPDHVCKWLQMTARCKL